VSSPFSQRIVHRYRVRRHAQTTPRLV